MYQFVIKRFLIARSLFKGMSISPAQAARRPAVIITTGID
jgi:hypothetical protein